MTEFIPPGTRFHALIQEVEASGSAARSDSDVESAPVRASLPADEPVQLKFGTE